MATRLVPFMLVDYPEERTFPEKTFDIFYEAGHADDDPFASIVRVSVSQESQRDEMRKLLRTRLKEGDAERLIWFLDDHDWDAAFLIDGSE